MPDQTPVTKASVTIALTSREIADVSAAAEKEGVKRAKFMREAVLKAAEKRLGGMFSGDSKP